MMQMTNDMDDKQQGWRMAGTANSGDGERQGLTTGETNSGSNEQHRPHPHYKRETVRQVFLFLFVFLIHSLTYTTASPCSQGVNTFNIHN
jgi:hypothetical protein